MLVKVEDWILIYWLNTMVIVAKYIPHLLNRVVDALNSIRKAEWYYILIIFLCSDFLINVNM